MGLYKKGDQKNWSGRQDEGDRFYKKVTVIDMENEVLPKSENKSFALLGFCCDEGVRRNLGRVGAKEGPHSLRKALVNKSFHTNESFNIYDCGDVYCDDGDLEKSQEKLAKLTSKIIEAGHFPLILGGGHAVAYGHYKGIEKAGKENKLGIINIDAHFDLRPLLEGGKGSSGTPFLQVAKDREKKGQDFSYLCLGVQESANTSPLFETAKELGAPYILASTILSKGQVSYHESLKKILGQSEGIYLTLCLDAFSFSVAPGVSAPSPFGIMPFHVLDLLEILISSGKLLSFDVAEMAPRFDEGGKTASLGAEVVSRLIQGFLDGGRK
ncbi:formimidoylglutamase [Bacteriovoracales bacterium]|nr:formimidoylglutamase [Bacteriovoracales bacterium]